MFSHFLISLPRQGMVYENTIIHQPHITRTVEPHLKPINLDGISIGIHARHKKLTDDGSDVSEYMACVDQMLEMFPKIMPCHLYVASDRPKTLAAIEREGRQRSCIVHYLDHDNEKRNMTALSLEIDTNSRAGKWDTEHGEFAGAPMFEDLEYFTNQVRSGFVHTAGVGPGSSASALYWQQITYRGIQDGSFTHPPPDCSPYLQKVRFHYPE